MRTETRPAPWATVLLVCSAVAVGAALVVAAGFAALVFIFNPTADEWHCSQGEAPALRQNGGSACFPEGSELPRGWRWDPAGNRPLAE
jgi:hypothetical protein